MSKKRGLFRGYRHGNRSMPKLSGSRDPEPAASNAKSMLEAALDKANTAVLYDQADDIAAAIQAYKEAVCLLEGFFHTASVEDQTRLRKIHDSYTERIQVLSEQAASATTTTAASTHTDSSNTTSSSDQSSMLHALTEGTAWRSAKKKMPFDDDATSTHTTESSKTLMGGFVSMLAKRSTTRLHHTTVGSVDPKPSKSTPISSLSRPSKPWLPSSGTKKKRHSTEYANEKPVSPHEMIPPPVLPAIAPVADSDDYFDLRSAGAADLLLPISRYSILRDPAIAATTSSSQPPPPPPPLLLLAPQQQRPSKSIPASAMEDAMDNLAKVLAESAMAFSDEEAGQEKAPTQQLSSARLAQRHDGEQKQQQQDRRSGFSSFWRSAPSSPTCTKPKPTLMLHKRSRTAPRLRSSSNASSTSSSTAASSPPTSPPSRWTSFEQARARSSLALSPKDHQQQRPISTITTASSIANASPHLLDPVAFMNQPPVIVSPVAVHLSLMQRLSRSMVEGAYLTERLYVPKELWYQPNIRLPALDAKLAACELLLAGLERLASLEDTENLALALKELGLLEQSLDQIRDNFARKFGIMQEGNDGNGSNHTAHSACNANSNNHNSHSTPSSPSSSSSISASKSSLSTWSNKLSKSVERMKLESSRTLDHQYIQALIHLLSSAQILDAWHTQYSETLRCDPSDCESYTQLLSKIETVTETMQRLVCGFILRDFSILFNKWSKRSRQWLFD